MVRAESDGKYSPSMACSARLRSTKARRSRSKGSVVATSGAGTKKSCSMAGMAPSAVSPNPSVATGTTRQPSTDSFSSIANASMTFLALAASSSSRGKKARPTA